MFILYIVIWCLYTLLKYSQALTLVDKVFTFIQYTTHTRPMLSVVSVWTCDNLNSSLFENCLLHVTLHYAFLTKYVKIVCTECIPLEIPTLLETTQCCVFCMYRVSSLKIEYVLSLGITLFSLNTLLQDVLQLRCNVHYVVSNVWFGINIIMEIIVVVIYIVLFVFK